MVYSNPSILSLHDDDDNDNDDNDNDYGTNAIASHDLWYYYDDY